MGTDHQLLHGIVHFPVVVPNLLTASFLGPVGAGFQIDTYGAVLAGNKGTEFLGAGFIRIDSNMPAGNLVTRVGGLGKVTQALLLVQPLINGVFSVLHSNGVEAQLHRPIGVLGWRFHNEILSGDQVGNVDAPRRVCGKGRAGDFRTILFDDELPAAQVVASVGRLSDFQGTDGQLVIEVDAGGSAVGDAEHLWILSGTGVARGNGTVGMPQFLDVVGSGIQPGNADSAACVRGVRTGYQGGTGGIGIHTETPTR